MRLFIAIPIPEAVTREALRWQEELRAVAPDTGIRWASAEQFHLTLMFLGEVDPARLEAVVAATRAACVGFGPFPLRAAQAGFFPNERNPRVLWAGLHCNGAALQTLQESVAARLAEFAEKQEDRRFSPHLTLARIKQIPPATVRGLAVKVRGMEERSLGEWQADCVRVMRSELHPSGSHHTCVEQIGLVQG